jgi:hypothetical protein
VVEDPAKDKVRGRSVQQRRGSQRLPASALEEEDETKTFALGVERVAGDTKDLFDFRQTGDL